MQTVSDSDWRELFQQLVELPLQIAIVISGGGSGSLPKCFRRAGASANFLEAVIPYSIPAMDEYLGEPACGPSASGPVAQQLARVAYGRAARLSESEQKAGLSLVAALPTNPPRRGNDRIHIAVHLQHVGWLLSRELPKHEYTRESAEDVADAMMHWALKLMLQEDDTALPKELALDRYDVPG